MSEAPGDSFAVECGVFEDLPMAYEARQASIGRDKLYRWLKLRAEDAEVKAERYRIRIHVLEQKVAELLQASEPATTDRPMEKDGMSWTGSESQRREQGVCKPPRKRVYVVSAGAPCMLRRASPSRGPWEPYVTTHETRHAAPLYPEEDGELMFRSDNYEIKIEVDFVRIE